jgi:hypothetical protein
VPNAVALAVINVATGRTSLFSGKFGSLLARSVFPHNGIFFSLLTLGCVTIYLFFYR